jgi:hypothetical protein
MVSLDSESQRKLAGELFNYVWTLLEKADRTARETELMVAAAYASRFFWELPGGVVQHLRGRMADLSRMRDRRRARRCDSPCPPLSRALPV